MELATYRHLVLRIIMSGDIPLLLLHSCVGETKYEQINIMLMNFHYNTVCP